MKLHRPLYALPLQQTNAERVGKQLYININIFRRSSQLTLYNGMIKYSKQPAFNIAQLHDAASLPLELTIILVNLHISYNFMLGFGRDSCCQSLYIMFLHGKEFAKYFLDNFSTKQIIENQTNFQSLLIASHITQGFLFPIIFPEHLIQYLIQV